MNKGQQMLNDLDFGQEEIARRCGATQQAVSFWIRGVHRPGVGYATKLRQVFGIPIEAWSILVAPPKTRKAKVKPKVKKAEPAPLARTGTEG